MRWHGVDPASVNLMGGLSAEEMLGRFRNGDADYLQVPYPFAGQLIDEGAGHLAVTLGNESGYVCYSSFAAMPAYVEENHDTVQRFVNGYARAQRWVAQNEPAAVAECIAPGVSRIRPGAAGGWSPAIPGSRRMGHRPDDWARGVRPDAGRPHRRRAGARGAPLRKKKSIVRPEFAERAMAGLA